MQALQESGIRSTQFAILVGIAKHQPVSIGALAEVLTIDQTTLTRSLRLLQKEGLITISERSTMRQRFLTIARRRARAHLPAACRSGEKRTKKICHHHRPPSIGRICGMNWRDSRALRLASKSRKKIPPP